jgi:hypothetical protein
LIKLVVVNPQFQWMFFFQQETESMWVRAKKSKNHWNSAYLNFKCETFNSEKNAVYKRQKNIISSEASENGLEWNGKKEKKLWKGAEKGSVKSISERERNEYLPCKNVFCYCQVLYECDKFLKRDRKNEKKRLPSTYNWGRRRENINVAGSPTFQVQFALINVWFYSAFCFL